MGSSLLTPGILSPCYTLLTRYNVFGFAGKIPRRVPRPNHPLDMEKDQDLLKMLLTKGDVASRTEVDVETSTVRVLDKQNVLEVPDEVYGSAVTPPVPPPAVSRVNLGEKKRRHHHSKKTQSSDSQVTYTGVDVSRSPVPKLKKT